MSTITVCRVCLESQKSICVPLSEKYQDYVLYEFINTITSLKIRLSDGLPDKICTSCHSQLISSIDFKQKCEASDVILRSHTVIEEQKLPVDNKISVKQEEDDKSIKIENDVDDTFDSLPDLEFEEDVKQEKSNNNNEFDEQPTIDRPSRAKDLKLICHDCGGSFTSKCKLKVHWKKTHMYDSLICQFCKRAFKSYKAFHQHRKKKTQSCATASGENVTVEGVGRARIFCCKHCDYRSKRAKDMTAHVVIHTGDRPFKCDICLKSYTQLSSLQGHQEIVHQMHAVYMTCHFCGKLIKGRQRIGRHLMSHTKVECPICHKSFTKPTYRTHMKRHGTKSYACEKCSCTFYTSSELCNHRRWKHKNSKLQCEKCNFTSNKERIMQTHRIKHNSNDIPCTICGRFFLTNDKLTLHQRVHFTEKKHSCLHCKSTFFKRDSLNRHIKIKHPAVAAELKTVTLVVKTETNGVLQDVAD